MSVRLFARRAVLAAALVLAPLAAAGAQMPISKHFRLEPLGDRVWAAIAVTGHAGGNAAIIDLGDAVMIVDPFMSPAAAKDLHRAATRLSKRPIKYVVYTQARPERVRGGQVFVSRDAQVHATQTVASTLEARERAAVEEERRTARERLAAVRQQLRTERDIVRKDELEFLESYYQAQIESHSGHRVVPARVTFDTEHTIRGRRRTVVLRSFGGGQTGSDAVVHLPAEGIVFAGGLVAINQHPVLTDADPAAWLRSLDALSALGATAVVPGQGPVGDSRAIANMRDYVRALQSARAGGDATVPPPFAAWRFRERYLEGTRAAPARLGSH